MGKKKLLKQALEMVEWVGDIHGDPYCPWCENAKYQGHEPNCIRQRALGIKPESRHEGQPASFEEFLRTPPEPSIILTACVDTSNEIVWRPTKMSDDDAKIMFGQDEDMGWNR